MPRTKRLKTDDAGNTISKKERKLLTHLRKSGQLVPDAGLEELLKWGQSHGATTRVACRQLWKTVCGRKNASSQAGTTHQQALLAHLQHIGQLGSDADIQDLLQWGESLGINDRKHLRRLGRNIKLGGLFNSQQLDAVRASYPQETDLENMVPSERVLLFYLQHTGQLPPDASLQDLLDWGKPHDHSTRDSLQSLGEAVGGGFGAQKAHTLPKTRSQTVASLGHKVKPKKVPQPFEARYRDDCKETNAGAMNWATMAADMGPSYLAIMTHLQLIGQLSLDADLQSLLQLGRECGFTHDALHDAGNDIRFGPHSASQEAYRERLQYLASHGVECMRAVLETETPGVDGQKTAAIEATNHFNLDVEEPAQRFWRQLSAPNEDLGHKIGLDGTDLEPKDTFADPMAFPKSVSPRGPEATPGADSYVNVPEPLDFSSAFAACDCSAPGMAVDRDTTNEPVAQTTQEAWQESLQVFSHPGAQSIAGSKIIEKCEDGSFTVNLLHDFDAMQAKRSIPARTTELVEGRRSSLQTAFEGRAGDSRRVDAGSPTPMDHSLDLEKEDVQVDLFFVDYDGDLDLSGRVQVSNGTLLDDMDIEGV